MLVNKSKIKKLFKDHDKRLSKEALEALDRKVESICLSAVTLCRAHRTVKPTEIQFAKG